MTVKIVSEYCLNFSVCTVYKEIVRQCHAGRENCWFDWSKYSEHAGSISELAGSICELAGSIGELAGSIGEHTCSRGTLFSYSQSNTQNRSN